MSGRDGCYRRKRSSEGRGAMVKHGREDLRTGRNESQEYLGKESSRKKKRAWFVSTFSHKPHKKGRQWGWERLASPVSTQPWFWSSWSHWTSISMGTSYSGFYSNWILDMCNSLDGTEDGTPALLRGLRRTQSQGVGVRKLSWFRGCSKVQQTRAYRTIEREAIDGDKDLGLSM